MNDVSRLSTWRLLLGLALLGNHAQAQEISLTVKQFRVEGRSYWWVVPLLLLPFGL